MTELFLEVVNRSISTGWLILAVLALRVLLKDAPKWVNMLLWGMVAFRLLCPVSVESILSLIPSAQTVSPGIMMDPAPTVSTGIPALNAAVNPVITASFAPNPGDSANPLQIWIPIAAAVWVCGMVCLAVYTAVSWWRLHRKVASAVRLREGLYQSEFVDSPFVLGILRPRIYLPFLQEGQAMDHIIAHEQAHIRRHDHWWKPLGFLLLTVYWFHPLMWAAYILLCRDMEMACDEAVIRDLNEEARADYAQALLSFSTRRRGRIACPLAFGEVGVRARVMSVLHYRRPGFWVLLVSAMLCLALAVCFLTDPVAPSMEVLPEVHSHTYRIQACEYEYNALPHSEEFSTAPSNFAIREDMTLLMDVDSTYLSHYGWFELGKLEEAVLTPQNFDELFYGQDSNVSRYRKDNARAWKLVREHGTFYLLLQQRNGELYFACGDTDSAREKETVIRWVFSLDIDAYGAYGMTVRSGIYTIPMTVFPEGTAIGSYASAIEWLIVDPGEDLLPFRTYKDGEEFTGHYLAFAAETYEPLPYTVSSGLEPQTYLFQNADPGREYIVLMLTGEEGADQYCFGVRFPAYWNPNNGDEIQETVSSWNP